MTGQRGRKRSTLCISSLVDLLSKISKGLPFPPARRSRREDDFDFEKILDHNRALESLLTPALHANELLESELIKTKMLLESEEGILAQLETNAKDRSIDKEGCRAKITSIAFLSIDEKVENFEINDHMGLGDDRNILPFYSHRKSTFDAIMGKR